MSDAAAIEDRRKALGSVDFTMEQKDEFHECFLNFADEEENLDVPALASLLEALGEELSEQEVLEMFREVDADGSGEVDFDEFIGMMRVRLLISQDSEPEMRSAFNLLDRDGSGHVDKEEIINVVVDFCGKLTVDEVVELIEWADVDANGAIDYAEFTSLLKQITIAERQYERFLEEADQ